MEIAAIISFAVLVVSWMAMPAERPQTVEAAPALQSAPAKA
jgi:hypothetical protein